ncbi:MAG: polyphenol oxidase family protein [Vampirovibrionales bacterium]|jgi:YfiH family protein|nr:polyphenol oxidase family protein [Vampirovibrionales bacterium]
MITTMSKIESVLLNAYAHRLRYGFSTKPHFVAGVEADTSVLDEHRQAWLKRFAMNTDKLAFPIQVHGNEYFAVSQAQHGEVDAILVDQPHSPAVVFSADCTPVILYAPDIHQGAVVHCGWKSTALGLAPKMVNVLREAGADVSKMIVVIAPALSLDGFEIDADVLAQLQASIPWEAQGLWYRKAFNHSSKFHADVPFVNELQLRHAGVRCLERLAMATDTHPDLLWSFRSGDWQRQGTFLELCYSRV